MLTESSELRMFSNEIIIATLGMILPSDHWYSIYFLPGSVFRKKQSGGSLVKSKQNAFKGGNGERL